MGAFNSSPREYTRYRVAVVGAPRVGKTSLVRTLARRPQLARYTPSAKVKIHSVWLRDDCLLQLHDVGGFAPARKAERSLQDADAVLLVYDHSRLEETLGVIMKQWIHRIYANTRPQTLFVLTALNAPPYTEEEFWPPSTQAEFVCNEQLPESRRRIASFGDLQDIQQFAADFLLELWEHIQSLQSAQQS